MEVRSLHLFSLLCHLRDQFLSLRHQFTHTLPHFLDIHVAIRLCLPHTCCQRILETSERNWKQVELPHSVGRVCFHSPEGRNNHSGLTSELKHCSKSLRFVFCKFPNFPPVLNENENIQRSPADCSSG